ncbi:hypothetical protein JMJ77_0001190, partial [Colletotrichum scovillei]
MFVDVGAIRDSSRLVDFDILQSSRWRVDARGNKTGRRAED